MPDEGRRVAGTTARRSGRGARGRARSARTVERRRRTAPTTPGGLAPRRPSRPARPCPTSRAAPGPGEHGARRASAGAGSAAADLRRASSDGRSVDRRVPGQRGRPGAGPHDLADVVEREVAQPARDVADHMSSRPGSSVVASSDRSASSGLATAQGAPARVVGGAARARPHTVGADERGGQHLDVARRRRAPATTAGGAAAPAVSPRPGGAAGSSEGMASYPSSRRTSSTRSAGRRRSGRQVGGVRDEHRRAPSASAAPSRPRSRPGSAGARSRRAGRRRRPCGPAGRAPSSRTATAALGPPALVGAPVGRASRRRSRRAAWRPARRRTAAAPGRRRARSAATPRWAACAGAPCGRTAPGPSAPPRAARRVVRAADLGARPAHHAGQADRARTRR